MPVQIDRMDTSVEILQPSAPSGGGAADRRNPATDRQMQEAVREVVGSMLAEELDRFVRNRGLGM